MPEPGSNFEQLLQVLDNGPIHVHELDESIRRTLEDWIRHMHEKEIIARTIQCCCNDHHLTLRKLTSHIEKLLITWSLIRWNGQRRRAADLLGIHSSTLYKKMRKYRIFAPKTPPQEPIPDQKMNFMNAGRDDFESGIHKRVSI
jgi:DNA-binding NtrC family response regulator